MINLFLPNEDEGLFGKITHWLLIGFMSSIFLGLPAIGVFCFILLPVSIFLMFFFD